MMNLSKPFLALVLAAGTLVACANAKNHAQDGAVPVDVEGELAAFFQRNPDGTAASFRNVAGRGFVINADQTGFAIPFGSTSSERRPTAVERTTGRTLCLRSGAGWEGACMNVFRNPDRTYFLEGQFTGGNVFRETVTLRAVPGN